MNRLSLTAIVLIIAGAQGLQAQDVSGVYERLKTENPQSLGYYPLHLSPGRCSWP